ncbi:hypothetical protein [Yeosuana marina]|uniref:hypothetical protein n=1 Tax=Yeosuana marina TaxID=1565536 RepID=UPI0014222151|nr:hypothetical protein [Yeosuana marina]
MKKKLYIAVIIILVSCKTNKPKQTNVITSDIDNFWEAYDLIIKENDSLKQISLIDSLYIKKGSIGLQKIMEVQEYTNTEYVKMINNYPKFLSSLKSNTLKSKRIANELNDGIERLRALYPELKPAKIFFTVGCLRTNGTTKENSVLIGSELAMADTQTDISEFKDRTKEWLKTFFATNPIKNIVLLNVHEYVHTQQNSIPDNLLYTVLYEGIAEFVSVRAMNIESSTEAIQFAKNNPDVKEKFEREMFYEKTYDWLWSNSPNEFGMRDLGYYIGYSIAESYYNQSSNKEKAIKELIELDYSNPKEVNILIDKSKFFSKTIEDLRKADKKKETESIEY